MQTATALAINTKLPVVSALVVPRIVPLALTSLVRAQLVLHHTLLTYQRQVLVAVLLMFLPYRTEYVLRLHLAQQANTTLVTMYATTASVIATHATLGQDSATLVLRHSPSLLLRTHARAELTNIRHQPMFVPIAPLTARPAMILLELVLHV